MDNYFRHMHVPEDLGHKFLGTFTRLEYALKASGFVDGSATEVSAAWDRFANHIDGAFQSTVAPDVRVGQDFLLAAPAQKQVIGGFGPLALDQNQTRMQRTLLVIRTVRNNIVHGGKIAPEGENEKGRNEKLVASSLTVLLHAVELHEEVRRNFQHDARSETS